MGWLPSQKAAFAFQLAVTTLIFLLGEPKGEPDSPSSKPSLYNCSTETGTPLSLLMELTRTVFSITCGMQIKHSRSNTDCLHVQAAGCLLMCFFPQRGQKVQK